MRDKQSFPIEPLLVDTNTAAAYLNLSPETLRDWSKHKKGPLTPVKIGNRLKWKLADVLKLAGA